MEKEKIIIVGAGLGGLQCGYILAKNGFKVTILEQNHLLGGYIQCYKRGANYLDTGFHYIGGLEEGKPLHKFFDYLGLNQLPWLKLDDEIVDEIVVGDKSYYYSAGIDNFGESLKKQIPGFDKEIDNYVDLLKTVGDMLAPSLRRNDPTELFNSEYFTQSAYEYLKSEIKDPLLIEILSGASLKMELDPEKLPLYIFAQVNSTFIQRSTRLRGGGMQIATTLAEKIKNLGGEIVINAKVSELIETEGKITKAILENGKEIEADYFISNAHPRNTIELIKNSKIIRNVYRKRINNLENTYGMFTTSIILKDNAIKYLNRNIFKYKGASAWSHSVHKNNKTVTAAMISFQPPTDNSEYVKNIDILTPMHIEEVDKWQNTSVFRRGEEYEKYKLNKADELIDFVSDIIPNLKDSVKKIYTSTPLTYRDYCGIHNGSAYGIRKDCNKLLYTMLTPKTPISNLFMTGQSLMIHGVLGVSMTSILTCSELIDKETLLNEIGI